MSEVLSFVPLAVDHLDLVRRWLAEPGVAAWWDEADEVFQAVLGPGEPEVSPWLMSVDGRPVGWIQCYEADRWPESFTGAEVAPGTIGIDMSIGEPDARDRGLGRRLLRAFVDEVLPTVAPDARDVWIDPDVGNERAIRCYLAAGFVDTGLEVTDPTDLHGPRRLLRLDPAGAAARPVGATAAIGSVAVYCGSSPGSDPAYARAAEAVGTEIARRGWRLVYGGGHVGLMGVVADAALAAGGEVVGVITRHLLDREVGHLGLTELMVVETMHQRKLAMSDRADAFVALPGGLGTLEELFEVVTWTQLGIHTKPTGLLDVAGYFAPLLEFLDGGKVAGFIRPEHRALLLVDDSPPALLDSLVAWTPSGVPKVAGPDLR